MNCLRSYAQHARNHIIFLSLPFSSLVGEEQYVGTSDLHCPAYTAPNGLFEGCTLLLGQFDF